jgi:hypothetical protein
MTRACWPAAPDGRYWIDVALGTTPARLMLDTGLVDPLHQVGFELAPGLFDALRHAGHLVGAGQRQRRDASGQLVVMEVGLVRAQLIDPVTRQVIGPVVWVSAFRGALKALSLVGVEFFHRLTGCRADWDFDNRRWCVECP